MRNAIGALIVAIALFAPARADAEERCYYSADAPFDAPQAHMAVDLITPFAPTEWPSADTEAAQRLYTRMLADELQSTASWHAAAPPQGGDHDRSHGIAVELKVISCARGLTLFRAYLDRLGEISTDAGVSATLSIFSRTVRAISAEEYDRFHPPVPTI